jgi:hypothetical protein
MFILKGNQKSETPHTDKLPKDIAYYSEYQTKARQIV